MRSPILSHQEFGFGIIPYFWPPVKVFSSSAPLLPGCFLVEASHVAGFTSSLAFFINSIFANFKTKKKKGYIDQPKVTLLGVQNGHAAI